MGKKKPAHTPGPWEVSKGLHGRPESLMIWPKRTSPTMCCPLIADVRDMTEGAEANASLIAAAPDMLAMLKYLAEEIATDGRMVGWNSSILDRVKGVIHNAEGGK